MEKISNEVFIPIFSKLKDAWNIDCPIWYPLYPTNRKHVIAFEMGKNFDENLKCFSELVRAALLQQGVKTMYLVQEDYFGFSYSLDIDEFTIHYLHMVEDRFWCDATCEWILYACHHGYMTVGGKNLIEEVAEKWFL